MRLLIPVFFLVFAVSAPAKRFATSYVSFELLNNWHCHPEGTEWVCANKLSRKKASEALIILTAKQKGPSDSLVQYTKYLKVPRTIKNAGGKGQSVSKVVHVKLRDINRHRWVDGIHQGSEVPIYFTRYLVTTKGNLSVLVSYSAHKNHYTKYSSDFAASIDSLRLLNTSSDFSGTSGGGAMGAGGLQDHIDLIDAEGELSGLEDESGRAGKGLFGLGLSPGEVAGALGFALATVVYFILKKKAKKLARHAEEQESSSKRDRHPRRGRSSSSDRRRRHRSSSSRRRR